MKELLQHALCIFQYTVHATKNHTRTILYEFTKQQHLIIKGSKRTKSNAYKLKLQKLL
jgi:hypothetical protein